MFKKITLLSKNRLAAEDQAAAGNVVIGSQVSVRTTQDLRLIDRIIQDINGAIRAIAVKSGNASRYVSQLEKDNELATQGGALVDRNAPDALRGQSIIIDTTEMRY